MTEEEGILNVNLLYICCYNSGEYTSGTWKCCAETKVLLLIAYATIERINGRTKLLFNVKTRSLIFDSSFGKQIWEEVVCCSIHF